MEFSAASRKRAVLNNQEQQVPGTDFTIPYEVEGSRDWVALSKGDVTTREARDIADYLIPEWWMQFKAKNNEYGTHDDDLGMRGQYADIHRKMKKLRNSLWDGLPLTHEQPREVILDLIGHLFLTLAKGDKDGWSQNQK